MIADYDMQTTGGKPSPRTLAMMTSPEALRARAAIREEIAKQDVYHGDTWAAQTNTRIATEMRKRAEMRL